MKVFACVTSPLIKLKLMALTDLITQNKKSIWIKIFKIIQNFENLDHICLSARSRLYYRDGIPKYLSLSGYDNNWASGTNLVALL